MQFSTENQSSAIKIMLISGDCSGQVHYELHYPQTETPAGQTAGFDRFWQEQARRLLLDCRREAAAFPVTISSDWQEMRNDRLFLSGFLDIARRQGYADWGLRRISATFSLKNGQLLPLSALFHGSWQPVLRREMARQLSILQQTDELAFFQDCQSQWPRWLTPQSYYLADDGLALWFPQERIAPRASGIPTILIPYSVLYPVLQIPL